MALAFVVTRLCLIAAGSAAYAWRPFAPALVPAPTRSPLLAMWVQWDAIAYVDLATRGYRTPPRENTFDMRPNYFPAYPWAIRLTAAVLGDASLAGLAVSNGAFALALVLLHGWMAARRARAAARALVWIYAAWPTGFFFSAVYAESLLLLGLAGAWLAADRGRWWVSGLSLAVAVLARPTGIAGLVLTVTAMRGLAASSRGQRVTHLLVPPLVAAVGYLIFASLTFGHPFKTIETQTLSRFPLDWPWQPFVVALRDGFYWSHYSQGIVDGLTAATALVTLPMVFRFVGAAEGLLATAFVLVPLSSGLISFARLVLPAFPLFVVLARLPGPGWLALVVATSLAVQMLLFAYFASGGWVG